MVQLKNKLEVLGYFSTFIFRGTGFEIVRTEVDEQSYISELFNHASQKTLFVTITYLEQDSYIYTTSVKGSEQNNVSCVLKYNEYFSDLKLPVSDDKLDTYYDNFKGNWAKTFPGAILQKVGHFTYLNGRLEPDNLIGLDPTQKFYFEVILPRFVRNKNNPSKMDLTEEEQVQLIKEFKVGICGIPIFPLDYDGQAKHSKNRDIIKQEEKLQSERLAESKAKDSLDLPKFDDEYELLRNKPLNQPFSSVIPSIGDNDVNPLGVKYPSMKPYLDPLADNSRSGFNGMIPDKSHPLFSGGLNTPGLNRGDHPPGSRYDNPTLGDESVELGLPAGSFRGSPFGRSYTNFNGNGGGSFGGPFGGNMF